MHGLAAASEAPSSRPLFARRWSTSCGGMTSRPHSDHLRPLGIAGTKILQAGCGYSGGETHAELANVPVSGVFLDIRRLSVYSFVLPTTS